jgi:hypothetical protein
MSRRSVLSQGSLQRRSSYSFERTSKVNALVGSIPAPQLSPTSLNGLHNPLGVSHVRTGAARISYYAALATTMYAAFSQRKQHHLAQRRQPRQEIRDTWAEKGRAKPTIAFGLGHHSSSEKPQARWRLACDRRGPILIPSSRSRLCASTVFPRPGAGPLNLPSCSSWRFA